MKKALRTAVLFLGISGLGTLAAAQTTGAVQGRVTDAQDAVLAGVSVQIVHTATNVAQSTTTGSAGNYVFDFLPLGAYALRVSAQGFKAVTVTNVLVEASTTASVNVRLELGQVTETVQVEAGDERVNTVDAQVSTNVGETYLRELPSYSRNVLTFAALQPGVEIDTQYISGGSQNLNILGTQAHVNGNRGQRNNFYLDGMDSRNYRNEALQMPNPDAVQEVQVSTSNTSAEYGRQVGGVFNVVTKSGTNSFHGDGFYFFRTKDLNASPWGVTTKPDQNQKTMGLTLGGPILKDRTFFFVSYDRYRDQSAIVRDRQFAPTAAMARGDFSAFLSGPNPSVIYDPATGLPFPGNVIPASAQDTVGRNIAGLLPTVATYGDHFVWTATQPARNQTFYAKLDHHWTGAHRTALTGMRSNGSATYPALDGTYISIPTYGPQSNESTQDLYHARHTWIVKNNLVADLRAGYTKHHASRDNFALDETFPGAQDPMAALGARNTTSPQEGARLYLPSVGIGNAGGGFGSGLYGHEGWLGLFDQPSFHFGGTVSWVKSRHSLKVGGDAIRTGQRYAVSGGAPAQTVLNFDGRFSSLGRAQNDFVYGMADLLLGRTTTFSQGGVLDYTIHNWDYFFFVQDEWKVSPRVTLSGGLRYEFYLPPSVKDNKRTEYFTTNPVQGSISTYRSTLFPSAPAGIAFAGDPGVPKGFHHTEKNLIAPRLGAAWDVKGDGTMAVRAGVGKYYGSTALQTKDWPSEQNPWQPAASCLGFTTASNPWLGCQANRFSAPPTPFTSESIQSFVWPNPVGFIYGFDPDFKTAYNYQWNVFVERELTKLLTVEVGYVGNVGRNLSALQNINFAEFTPSASGGNVQARRPNQGYGNIIIATSIGKSSYNALQAAANVRVRDSLLSRLTYTYQRGYADCGDDPVNIGGACYANPRDPAGERGETTLHHAAKLFFTWSLPFARDNESWTGRLLGGWRLSGSGAIYSGSPLNVTLNQDWNFDGVFGDRPDAAGPIQYQEEDLGGRNFRWVTTSGLAAPGCPATGCTSANLNRNRFGTLDRNAVFGPGYWTFDAALLKDFRLSKSRYLQLRFEAYNVFNHPRLNNPNLDFQVDQFGVANPGQSFGIISGKSSNPFLGPRLIQLGLKLHF